MKRPLSEERSPSQGPHDNGVSEEVTGALDLLCAVWHPSGIQKGKELVASLEYYGINHSTTAPDQIYQNQEGLKFI